MRLRPFETTIDDMVLRGTLQLPQRGDGPFPTAVLHHGFGANRTEGMALFVALGRALSSAGIATLAYDRAGHGESDGSFFHTTVSGDIAHARQVLGAAAGLDEVDDENLHLVGLSMGAVIASIVAATADERVRSLTMWSTAAVFVDEIRDGTLQGRPVDTAARDGYFDFNGLRVGAAFFADVENFDVYGLARGYAGPVRMLHGTDDFVPVSYAHAYRDIYGDSLDLTIVPGANHGWGSVPSRELVIAETVRFITVAGGVRAANSLSVESDLL